MTELERRADVVAAAEAWAGVRQGSDRHRQLIDLYNANRPENSYKMSYSDPWCAAFVSAVGISAGVSDIMPPACSCSRLIALYRERGRWQEEDGYLPKPGDLVLYDWDDTGKGDCTGAPEHVGMVVGVYGNLIRVIEGNKNRAVGYRNVPVNGRYIRGFCLPDFAAGAEQPDPARHIDRELAGVWSTTADINLRMGAGTDKKVVTILPVGTAVTCYGYYTERQDTPWLYVHVPDQNLTGYCCGRFLSPRQNQETN